MCAEHREQLKNTEHRQTDRITIIQTKDTVKCKVDVKTLWRQYI